MQPPAGYPQQQPNPQQPYPQQPYPQQQHPHLQHPQQAPYPQQYGMQQYPYYPPPKRGMPGWAIALIIVGVVCFLVVPILALAAIPLLTSNTRDARRAEGEQLMGAARDYCRVQYSKTGTVPTSMRAAGAAYGEFDGEYFKIDDAVRSISGPSSRTGSSSSYSSRSSGGYGSGSQWAEITCTPVSSSDGRGHCEFSWASGESNLRWD